MSRRGLLGERQAVQERLAQYRREREARTARASAARVILDSDSSDDSDTFVSAVSEACSRSMEGGAGSPEAEPQDSGDEGATSKLNICHGTPPSVPEERTDVSLVSSARITLVDVGSRASASDPDDALTEAIGQLSLGLPQTPTQEWTGDPGRPASSADTPKSASVEPKAVPCLDPPTPLHPAPELECVRDDRIEDGSLALDAFHLRPDLASKLYPHQRVGVEWLWKLFKMETGGILADDMGLGKTMQCCAFIAGLLGSGQARRVLIAAPKTLLAHWSKELGVCGLGRQTSAFLGGTPAERRRVLDRTAGEGGVLLTTYGMVQHNAGPCLTGHSSHDPAEGPLWDLLILDEGHKLKNPKMELRAQFDLIPVRTRVIISGTPIQNNLREMWALFDFTTPGLLGDAKTFKDVHEKRIIAGNDRQATQGERERGAAAALHLRTLTGPYMLRREKGEMALPAPAPALGSAEAEDMASAGAGHTQAAPSWTQKSDFIVWLRLKPLQLQLYQAFLQSPEVRSVLNQSRSALAALTVMKKICDHPALLSERAQRSLSLASGPAAAEEDGSGSDSEATSQRLQWLAPEQFDLQTLVAAVDGSTFLASCKTEFVMGLLRQLAGAGHRTLVFSQSTKMLNILESALRREGMSMCRIDGSVASVVERAARVDAFQTRDDIPVFLLSSAVGGLGLTLTAADRVIIVDPAWNPAVDNQAVDRAYRIGQRRDVIVYRLISCGTVEEKIYRKQVFKSGLFRTGTEEGEQFRYFANQELRDLFKLDMEETRQSVTQRTLHDMHAEQRRMTPDLAVHLDFLQTLDGFTGVSDHDLLYSEKEARPVKVTSMAVEDNRRAAAARPGSAVTPGGGRRGARTGPSWKAGATGWAGAGELSNLFARSVSLGATPAHAPGRPPAEPGDDETSAAAAVERRLATLRATLAKQRQLLDNPTLLRSLGDGGARIQRRVAELEREVREVELDSQACQREGREDVGGTRVPGLASGVNAGPAAGLGNQSQAPLLRSPVPGWSIRAAARPDRAQPSPDGTPAVRCDGHGWEPRASPSLLPSAAAMAVSGEGAGTDEMERGIGVVGPSGVTAFPTGVKPASPPLAAAATSALPSSLGPPRPDLPHLYLAAGTASPDINASASPDIKLLKKQLYRAVQDLQDMAPGPRRDKLMERMVAMEEQYLHLRVAGGS